MFEQSVSTSAYSRTAHENDDDDEDEEIIIVDDIDEEEESRLRNSSLANSATSSELTELSTASASQSISDPNEPSLLASRQLHNIRHHGIIQILDLFNSKYDCKICRQKLRYKADEIIHVEFKHKKCASEHNNAISCPFCKETLRTYHQLTRHLMIKHLNERPYGCRLCKKRFSAFIKLKKHCVQNHVAGSNNISGMNNSLSSTASSLSSNSSTASSGGVLLHELIEYENSNLSFQSPNPPLDLDTGISCRLPHRTSHQQDEDDFFNSENELCPRTGARVETFTLITKLSHHQCDRCMLSFYSSSDYLIHCWKSHMSLQLPAATPPASCPINKSVCWLCFSSTAKWPAHVYEFANDHELKTHLLVEHLTEEFEFKCSLCSDQVFIDMDQATEHYLNAHLDLDDDDDNDDDDGAGSCSDELSLVFACFNCEQIYTTLNAVEAHFAQSFNCNAVNRSKRLKCCQDRFEFNSQKAYELHLYQHNYLERLKMQQPVFDSAQTAMTTTSTASLPIVYRKTPIFSSKTAVKTHAPLTPVVPASLLINEIKFDLMPSNTSTPFSNSNTQNSAKITKTVKRALPLLKPLAVKLAPQPPTLTLAGLFNSTPVATATASVVKEDESGFEFPCDVCGHVRFKTERELDEHLVSHSSRNPKRQFSCHLCRVTFVKVDQLKRHMIVHQASDRDFVCQICFSSFSRRQDLDRHMLFHNNNKNAF